MQVYVSNREIEQIAEGLVEVSPGFWASRLCMNELPRMIPIKSDLRLMGTQR